MRAEVQLTQPEMSEHAGYGIIRQCWTRRLVVRVHGGAVLFLEIQGPGLSGEIHGRLELDPGDAPFWRSAVLAEVAAYIFESN